MNAPRDRHSNATAHLRSVSYGPLLYRRMVGRVDGSPADGDLVRVLDRASKPFGWAFYSAASQIALRMVSYGEAAPGESFLSERIARAVGLRRDVLRLDDVTDAYRLVHAEGDGLSGLVADRFGEYVVLELFSKAMFLRLGQIEDAFIDAGLTVRRFVRRADDEIARAEGFRMGKLADAPRCVTQITENGLKFEVDLTKGHKTGFFCDQRENRQALTHFTPGKSVLDMCCYSAGFSCYAAGPGRAADVTAVDIDETALETARRNVKLNRAAVDVRQSDALISCATPGATAKAGTSSCSTRPSSSPRATRWSAACGSTAT
ncbi:MAG TPA: class I SAM-dependent methyltransferase [Phycisphaerae bacterium]|nr:class I SAM-dependent methyltransferase [Phycisphaerae bacterium]